MLDLIMYPAMAPMLPDVAANIEPFSPLRSAMASSMNNATIPITATTNSFLEDVFLYFFMSFIPSGRMIRQPEWSGDRTILLSPGPVKDSPSTPLVHRPIKH